MVTLKTKIDWKKVEKNSTKQFIVIGEDVLQFKERLENLEQKYIDEKLWKLIEKHPDKQFKIPAQVLLNIRTFMTV